MSEKNPLRRFSERRRARRNSSGSVDSTKAGRPRRIAISARISVLPVVVDRLALAAKRFKLSRARLIGGVLEWFAVQPKLIQSAILRAVDKGRKVDFSSLLKQLLAG